MTHECEHENTGNLARPDVPSHSFKHSSSATSVQKLPAIIAVSRNLKLPQPKSAPSFPLGRFMVFSAVFLHTPDKIPKQPETFQVAVEWYRLEVLSSDTTLSCAGAPWRFYLYSHCSVPTLPPCTAVRLGCHSSGSEPWLGRHREQASSQHLLAGLSIYFQPHCLLPFGRANPQAPRVGVLSYTVAAHSQFKGLFKLLQISIA